MKIKTNETNLDAKKLQQLFSLVHKVVAKYEGRLRWWKRLKVHMSYYRGIGYHCRATLGGTNIWMRMCIVSYNNVERVSQVFAHELYHSYGYNHKGFRRFPLDEKQIVVPETKETLIVEKYPIDVELRGSFIDFGNFLDELAFSNYYLTISNIQISQNP